MNLSRRTKRWTLVSLVGFIVTFGYAFGQQAERGQSSYMPVDIKEPFVTLMTRLSGEKAGVEQEHAAVLNDRYDLSGEREKPPTGFEQEDTPARPRSAP